MAPNGDFLKEGDTVYQLQLADTLEAIAEQGIGYFYNSNFMMEMVTELQQNYGSILTVEDFQRYTAIERQIVTAQFKDHNYHVEQASPSMWCNTWSPSQHA